MKNLNKSEKQAIIFDLDGTLLDTNLLIQKSFVHVFEQYKPDYQLSDEELLSFLGPTLTQSFEQYFNKEILEELIDCYRKFNQLYHNDYVEIYPGVETALKKLKEAGYPLAIVTTKMASLAYAGLDLFNIRHYFDIIICEEDVTHSKPDPEGLNLVLKKSGIANGFYIGDNVSDIKAGKNAHLSTVGVKWASKGYESLELENPDFLIEKMEDILEIIK